MVGSISYVVPPRRITIGSSDRGPHLRCAKEGVDDWDKSASFGVDAFPRRSTSSLGLNMDVTARFSAAREFWMSRYIDALRDYRLKYQPGGPEVLLQLSDNGVARPFRLYRIDLASGSVNPPNLTDVNPVNSPEFETERITLPSGLAVTLEPFHWNGVEFLVQGMAHDFSRVADWCLQWIDESESNQHDVHGLLGAIHSVTAPEVRDDGVFFSVDFGSAPIEAVNSLIDLLSLMGANAVRISSTWASKT